MIRGALVGRATSLGLYFAGAAVALVFLGTTFAMVVVPLAAGVLTAAYAARDLTRESKGWKRALGALGWAITLLAHAFWVYLAIAWGSVLAWTVAWWGLASLALFSALVVVTARRPRGGVRAPIALPLGAWIGLCLLGWRLEEQRARCDDFFALGADPRLRLVERSSRDLDACSQGRTVRIGRYPRAVWESEDRTRWIVTTSGTSGGSPPAGARFTGSVCELSSAREPLCVGDGKGQGIVEAPSRDRIFLATWGHFGGPIRGRVLAIPQRGAFAIAAEARTTSSVVGLLYDQRTDRLYGLTDEGGEIVPFDGSTLQVEPSISAPLPPPDAIRYDQARGEGLICAAGGPILSLEGKHFLSVAVRGDPLSLRAIGNGPLALAALTWGCDFDPVHRRAWVAIPNLGLLATIDYDTGALIRTDFVGFGLRSVTHDPDRGRLYLTSFLSGHVIAVDVESGREVERWSVGRFPRTAVIGRDKRSLLVGTNLGLVSIALAATGP